MKHIKLFENFSDEANKFNNLSHVDKITYLINNFSMDRSEAMEICPDNSVVVDDLPDEIRETFYDETY